MWTGCNFLRTAAVQLSIRFQNHGFLSVLKPNGISHFNSAGVDSIIINLLNTIKMDWDSKYKTSTKEDCLHFNNNYYNHWTFQPL